MEKERRRERKDSVQGKRKVRLGNEEVKEKKRELEEEKGEKSPDPFGGGGREGEVFRPTML